MRKCLRCETINDDNLKSCFVCGYDIENQQKQQAVKKPNVPPLQGVNVPPHQRGWTAPELETPQQGKPDTAGTSGGGTRVPTLREYNPNPVPPVRIKEKPKTSTGKIIGAIAGCAAAVVIFCFGLSFLNGRNDNKSSVSDEKASAPVTTEAAKNSAETAEAAHTISGNISSPCVPDGSLGEGGDKLTILCWTDDDLKYMYDAVEYASGMNKSMIVYKNVGTSGGEASEKYTQILASGADADLYFCDADWNYDYQNDDRYSAPLSAVGITEDMYKDAYSYTVDMGKDENGVLKGATWQCCPGGYVYRTDLAKDYLGVNSPEEMQKKIGTWDDFWSAAKTVYSSSGGKTAMADSLDGVWRAYSCGIRSSAWLEQDGELSDEHAGYLADFIKMAKANYDAGYISTVSQWTDEWLIQGMSAGSLADGTMGFFFPTWSLGESAQLYQAEGKEGAAGSTYGMWNVCTGPAEWFWGGSWICVSPKTDNASEAGSFIYYMTVCPESMQYYAITKSDFVNNKSVMAEVIDLGLNSNPLLGGQDQLAALADSAEKIRMTASSEVDTLFENDFKYAVQAYCMGEVGSTDECVDYFTELLENDIEALK